MADEAIGPTLTEPYGRDKGDDLCSQYVIATTWFRGGVKPWIVSTAWIKVLPFAPEVIQPWPCSGPEESILAKGLEGGVRVVVVDFIGRNNFTRSQLKIFICQISNEEM